MYFILLLYAQTKFADFYAQTLAGFTEAMTEYGITKNPAYSNLSASSEESAYKVAKKLFNAKSRPTAVLCTVDRFSIGVMKCAKDMSLSIPEDISIIGIDDILLSRYIEPRLTTIGIDKSGMGTLAMDMIVKKIKGEAVESILLPMELIERDSVKTIK